MAGIADLLLMLLLSSAGSVQAGSGAGISCEPTPSHDSLDVVGPMAGSHPAWLVDGSDRWGGATHPVKTLWVVARTSHRVQITGRLLDGAGAVGFRRGSSAVTGALVVEDPSHASVIPAGATSELLRAYSFIPSHVFYARPGCWEFTVRIGEESLRIVREVAPAK